MAPAPDAVSTALRERLAGRFPGAASDVEVPVRLTGGFDFWVYSLHFGGPGLPAQWAAPLVARIPAAPERYLQVQQESRLQDWVAAQGYPAPSLVELVAPGELFGSPVQVISRVPGITMLAAMQAAPWHMRRLTGRLAAAQAALHRLPAPDWVDSGQEWSLVERQLSLTRRLVELGTDPGLAQALERTERLLPQLEVSEPVICHGDFHPGNLLVGGDTVSVIDWTVAGIGDRHGDIARTAWLLRLGAVMTEKRAERLVLQTLVPGLSRTYLARYRHELPVDAARLRLWAPVPLLHAWAMTVADEQEFFGQSAMSNGSRVRVAAWAQKQFRRRIEGLS
jgi:aminoglycoside phosphotransferase (APT) family kinase protein